MKFSLSLLLTSLLLTACASGPSPSLIDLTLQAKVDQNPDLVGRSSPTVIQLFELKNVAAFNSADFFDLYKQAEKTLEPDLVAVEKFNLRPGETKQLKIRVKPGSQFLGVTAAYRSIDQAIWRYILVIEPETQQDFELELTKKGIVRIVRISEINQPKRHRGAVRRGN